MALKSTTGAPARGKDGFFERPYITNRLWKKIEDECNILIAAPRRVGKTSQMFYLLDNPHQNYCVIYVITEAVNDENEFYRRIINVINKDVVSNAGNKYSVKFRQKVGDIFSYIKSLDIRGNKIELNNKVINYQREFIDLVKSLELKDKKILIMVDEFAQMLENIIKDKSESTAVHLLEGNRELRMDRDISKRVKFMYTGSIGLATVVSRLNAVNLISDLYSFAMPPLSKAEVENFIDELTSNLSYKLPAECVDYILKKTEWLLPFYIQLVIDEISNLYDVEQPKVVNTALVERAFKELLKQRTFFEHWHTRLRKSYVKNEYEFAKNTLNIIAERGEITVKDIFELAEKMSIQTSYKEILNSLVYDGYINNDADVKVYKFNSPILKEWWYENVAN